LQQKKRYAQQKASKKKKTHTHTHTHVNSQILNQKRGEVIQLKMNPITRTESKQDKWIKKEQYF